ncbi:MAG: hypothetical protein A2177_12380 [Spirochaetes bacterium RBG_13_68_11]|nr:MAG: hypothetical protein A2177_12380 [Spirochaetes bacterium RBG_13_68_11]
MPKLSHEVTAGWLHRAAARGLPDEIEVHEIDVARRHVSDDIFVFDTSKDFRGDAARLGGDHRCPDWDTGRERDTEECERIGFRLGKMRCFRNPDGLRRTGGDQQDEGRKDQP